MFSVSAFQQRPSRDAPGRVVHPRLFRVARRAQQRRVLALAVALVALGDGWRGGHPVAAFLVLRRAASLSRRPASRNRGFQPRRPSRHRHPDLRRPAPAAHSRFVCRPRRPPPGFMQRARRPERETQRAHPRGRQQERERSTRAGHARVFDEDTFGSPPHRYGGAPPPSARRWTRGRRSRQTSRTPWRCSSCPDARHGALGQRHDPVAEARERAGQAPVEEDTAPSAAVSAAVTNAEPSMVARNPVVSPRRPQA